MIGITIGILGAGSFWIPFLGIPIAILTIIGAWTQVYENVQTQKEIQALYKDVIEKIGQAKEEALLRIEQVKKEERSITTWSVRILTVIVDAFHWINYDRYVKRWIRKRYD